MEIFNSTESSNPPNTSTEQPSITKVSPPPFYIVGIGASAGGLEALVKFFSVMPPNSGLAFVVVQHLSPDFKSVMDELLARHTEMPIHLVEDRIEIEANCVYLIPPKKEMVLLEKRLLLTDKDPTKSLSLPIDVFFRSLAQDVGEKAIAIVLSGTGSDGSRGIVDIHDVGGMIIAQSEESAKFNGMPRSAIETGMVDYVLAPEEIPQAILKYTGSSLLGDMLSDNSLVKDPEISDHYIAIFQRLRAAYKVDFSYYKPTTVNRRIERRMAHHKVDTLEEYVAVLDDKADEVDFLYEDLLINVTKFFRDPEAFRILEEEVIPQIITSKNNHEQIRIWVPACSSGEEAYAIAMLFNEAVRRSPKKLDVKIFGTDLDKRSITTAATGIYSKESIRFVSKKRIEMFFNRVGERYQVNTDLRKMIVFAEQNLLKDPPFTKIDLISCRNMLIYLQPIAQKKIITMFLFSLKIGGTLILGPSESLGDMEDEYDTIDRLWNFFRKRRDVRISPALNLQPTHNQLSAVGFDRTKENTRRRSSLDADLSNAYDDLLAIHMPPSLLIGNGNRLIHVFGAGSDYINRPKGRATLDVLTLVDGNLRLALSTALQRVQASHEAITLSNIPFERNDEDRIFLDLLVRPLKDKRFVIAQFIEHKRTPKIEKENSSHDFDVSEETQTRISELEKELQFSRENLQATIEELETSNEELQATNEELLASNEELQSTNEELQSVNEELFTVNTEYEKKNKELTQLNSDIDNLLQSSEIGTIFIDNDLRIRKFTPAIAETFNLLPMDIGRPLEHITFNIVDNPDLVDQTRNVINTRESLIKEVRNRNGQWQLMRIFPYITSSRKSSGAVLTLVDISPIKQAEEDLKEHIKLTEIGRNDLEQFAYSVSHDLQEPLRSISGYLDLLKKRFNESDSETQDYLNFALEGSAKMKAMINGLLIYTRIESRMQPFAKTSLLEVLEKAKASNKAALESNNATLSVKNDDLSVYGDPSQLVTLFGCIIENSLKFRDESMPVISIKAELIDNDVSIRIQDNGIGIEPVNQKDVFKLFYTEHPTNKYPGIGLGLALCKRIVLKNGGQISLESEINLGTTITIVLPNRNKRTSNGAEEI